MGQTNNQSSRTKLSLFFERKTSLALLQLSALVALLLVGLMLKSGYEVYVSQSSRGEKVEVLAEIPQSTIKLPTIDISASRLKTIADVKPSYNSTTPFKVKEAAITLIKRGHTASGIAILKNNPETRKLGEYLEEKGVDGAGNQL